MSGVRRQSAPCGSYGCSSDCWFYRICVAALRLRLPQGAVSPQDLQTRCIVNSIPNAEALSVSWTGGVQCRPRQWRRRRDRLQCRQAPLHPAWSIPRWRPAAPENVRDCAGNVCADDVPRSLLRLHRAGGSGSADVAAGVVGGAGVAAPPVAAVPTQSEVRAVDGVYRGQIRLIPHRCAERTVRASTTTVAASRDVAQQSQRGFGKPTPGRMASATRGNGVTICRMAKVR